MTTKPSTTARTTTSTTASRTATMTGRTSTTTVWFLVGNGGMDPYSSPYIIPKYSPHNPFPHSLLRTRQTTSTTRRPPETRSRPRGDSRKNHAETTSDSLHGMFERLLFTALSSLRHLRFQLWFLFVNCWIPCLVS